MSKLLHNLLSDLLPYLKDDSVSDISINQPGEAWLDNGIISQRVDIKKLSLAHCQALARQIATHSEQSVSEEDPLLSAHLPTGERIQIVMCPATWWLDEDNTPSPTLAISIRKLKATSLVLNQYAKNGGFSRIGDQNQHEQKVGHHLKEFQNKGEYSALLQYAVKNHQTILISGATYSGKTSFLNMLLKEIPLHERLITIEDVPELHVPHPNRVRLFYSRGGQGRALIQAGDLVLATLRMRPDRIILGELRGDDAVHWLTAANSGHPGTLATIHADEPTMALEKLTLMVMAHHTSLGRDEVYRYVTSIVDIVVQLKRDHQGLRYVSDILLTKK
jgi:type IV secretion system protein VirB11